MVQSQRSVWGRRSGQGRRRKVRPRASRRPLHGFTLVELLVVITIIGILIALLLPAVQAAREAARRLQCTNNSRQLALAAHLYHDASGQFPPGYGYFPPEMPYAGNRSGAEWPWCVRLLPYMEQSALADAIEPHWGATENLAGNATSETIPESIRPLFESDIGTWQCPSDPMVKVRFQGSEVGLRRARTSYAASLGIGPMEGTLVPAAKLLTGLESTERVPGAFGYNYGASINQISDGTSNTLMLSELTGGHSTTVRGSQTYDEGPVFMANYCPNDRTPDIVRWCDAGDADGDFPCLRGSGTYGGALTIKNMVVHTSRSMHPGGVVSTMCDGSAHFISSTISLTVWQFLATPSGGEIATIDF